MCPRSMVEIGKLVLLEAVADFVRSGLQPGSLGIVISTKPLSFDGEGGQPLSLVNPKILSVLGRCALCVARQLPILTGFW